MSSGTNSDIQEIINRIKIIQTKGESIKMRSQEKFKFTLIETQELLENNTTYINQKKADMNFVKIIEELSQTVHDLEFKLTTLSIITFCRDKAEKYLRQVTEKLHNLNLVLITLLSKKEEIVKSNQANLIDQMNNINKKLSLIETNFFTKLNKTKVQKIQPDPQTSDTLFLQGVEYYLGLKNRVDLKKSYDLFFQASNAGSINAKIMLARMYEKGEYVEKTILKAFDHYKQAANSGNSHAAYMLGNYAENGMFPDTKSDVNRCETVVKYYQKSADQQNSAALARLGIIYENGLLSQSKDIKKAIEYYKRAIELDENPEAMNSLSNLYYKGDYLKQNFNLALECFTTAAKLGNADAMNNAGICYEFGKGVGKNYNQAMVYFKQAIAKLHPEAMANQAILLIKSNKDNDKNKFKEASKLLHLSTHLDTNNKDALYYQGYLCENGFGTKSDAYLAYVYYKKAMKLGHLKAKTKVALALLNGIEGKIEKDEDRSICLLTEASRSNESEALNIIGLIHEKGIANFPKSIDKSIECFNKSQMLGYDNAVINLALAINSQSLTTNSSNASDFEDSYLKKIEQMSKKGNRVAKSVLDLMIKTVR